MSALLFLPEPGMSWLIVIAIIALLFGGSKLPQLAKALGQSKKAFKDGLAEGESKYNDVEKRLAAGPIITVPAITLEGDANGAPHPEPASYASKFAGKYQHRTLGGGIGHNLPQEAPEAFAKAVIDVNGYTSA